MPSTMVTSLYAITKNLCALRSCSNRCSVVAFKPQKLFEKQLSRFCNFVGMLNVLTMFLWMVLHHTPVVWALLGDVHLVAYSFSQNMSDVTFGLRYAGSWSFVEWAFLFYGCPCEHQGFNDVWRFSGLRVSVCHWRRCSSKDFRARRGSTSEYLSIYKCYK